MEYLQAQNSTFTYFSNANLIVIILFLEPVPTTNTIIKKNNSSTSFFPVLLMPSNKELQSQSFWVNLMCIVKVLVSIYDICI